MQIAVRSDLIDRNSVRMQFNLISSTIGGDSITITAQDGQTRTVTFPGCYHVSLSFRVNIPIANPYVEAFLQLGTNIPCQSNSASRVANVCTNITQTNWCPKSTNTKLRNFLTDKKTCRFCHLCETLKSEEGNLRKYVHNEGTSECGTNKQHQTVAFKCRLDQACLQQLNVQLQICTPSKEQWREENPQHEEKLQEYWNYLKQGVLTAVVHVMERSEPSEKRMEQCKRLCSTFSSQKALSSSYRSILLQSIEKMCTPTDVYAACIYHTMKFDVNEN
ncbi:unnamed protein product [Toxocara canis]|uniref:Spiggin beta n=1 Tax=Toxocara canis TaxID=6265 RepID=A0A183USI4_TOXCA|nr:unnamed protein product [Toxocara canis]